ncbi:MAG: hypothetical protein L0L69_05965, partial [Propionibacterium sp.]|nr:hypothetical protein [Propionibacterium sp.]
PALDIPTADPVAAGRPHADPAEGEDPTSGEPASGEPTPVSLALADRIGGNGDSPLAWRCGSISVEGPSHLLPQLEATTLAIASRIASTRHLPLHVCSSARERSADASTWIPPVDPGGVAVLMEGFLAHGPAVLALTDPPLMVESLDRGLGPGSGRSWWARLLAGADRAGLVVVVLQRSDLAPGTVGAPARLPHRLIQLTTVEDALRAGLPSTAPTSHLPGRLLALGFHEHGAGPLRCQVPLEAPSQGVPSGDEVASAPATTPATTPGSAPATTHHRSVEQPATGGAKGGTTALRRLSGDGRTWSVRAEPCPDERLPDWALAWAGAGLEPLEVIADQDWVVVAHDPGPALARLELLGRAHAGNPRAPGHVAGAGHHEGATLPDAPGRPGGGDGHPDGARQQAQGGVRDTGVRREAAAAHGTGSDVTLPDGTRVTVLPPSRWAQVAALRGNTVLALDPGPELLGVLAADSRQASQALRAFRWGPCSGVLAISGQLIRIVLPSASARAGGPRQGPDPAGAGHSP